MTQNSGTFEGVPCVLGRHSQFHNLRVQDTDVEMQLDCIYVIDSKLENHVKT